MTMPVCIRDVHYKGADYLQYRHAKRHILQTEIKRFGSYPEHMTHEMLYKTLLAKAKLQVKPRM